VCSYSCSTFCKKLFCALCSGGKVKKHSRGEFNFEATTAKVQALSFFDQHVVTWQCTVTVVEMLSSFASGSSNYLPVQEHVAFLFDLMELALSIYDLIDVCIQVILTKGLKICFNTGGCGCTCASFDRLGALCPL
jgi:mediator of RNA polymerase II transcription subunit 12